MTWKKGQSGNPAGRRSRGPDGKRQALRESIAVELPKIVTKLTELALAGDVQAARTLLERVLPPIKAESHRVDLPEVLAANSPTEQANAVLRAVARGELAPESAAQVLAGLGQAARVRESDELKREIEELRKRITP